MRGAAIAAALGVIAGFLSAYFGGLTATRHHSLAFELATDRPGVIQVYFDRGEGFVEQESVAASIAGHGFRRYRLPLPLGDYLRVRVDPVQTGPAHIEIRRAFVVDDTGRTVSRVPLERFRALNAIAGIDYRGDVLALDIAAVDDPAGVFDDFGFELAERPPKINGAFARNALVRALFFGALFVAGWSVLRFARRQAQADRVAGIALVVFVLALALIVARSADALLNPALYTEDGDWIPYLFRRAYWDGFVAIRPDYFVAGNLALLGAAWGIDRTLFGDDVTQLPRVVAAVSYAFYALVATSPVVLLRRLLPPEGTLTLAFAIALIPLGDSANEVLGRLSNIGFTCAWLAFAVLAYRHCLPAHAPLRRAACDIVLALLALTNPVVLLLVFGYAGWLLVRSRVERASPPPGASAAKLGSLVPLVVATIALATWIAWRTMHANPGHLKEGADPARLVEFLLARNLVYPLAFPVYEYLDDTLAIVAALALIIVVAWLVRRRTPAGRFALAAGLALVVSTAIVLVSRPGLVNLQKDYAETMLDRYFITQNLFVMTAIVGALCAALSRGPRFALLARTGLAALVVWYAANADFLLELGWTRYPIVSGPTWAEAVRDAYVRGDAVLRYATDPAATFARRYANDTLVDSPGAVRGAPGVETFYRVPTYYAGWEVLIPARNAEATAWANPITVR